MKKFYQCRSIVLLAIFTLVTIAAADGASLEAQKTAYQQFITANPQAHFYDDGTRITRIYGPAFGGGSSAEDAAEQFRSKYAPALGVMPDELVPTTTILPEGNTKQLMYDRNSGKYKFTLVIYSQYLDGIPVYMSELRLLVRNEPGYPLVLAATGLHNLGEYRPDQAKALIDPLSAQRAFAVHMPSYTKFSEPRTVIWAGTDKVEAAPAVGVEFVADDGQEPTNNRYRFIVDPASGEILYQEDMIIDVNVTGRVNGNATENFLAEQCGNEVSTGMPWAQVNIVGGSSAYADSAGNFTISNSGSNPVTVRSLMRGHWFVTHNAAGSDDTLSLTVTPPGPANFLHNPTNTEYRRAEVNGYLHANVVRDYTLKYDPTYPTIYNQASFPVNVNRNDGYCPGNAWYDGTSINFCRTGSGYPNTAFSTVVHHEYGHHLVQCAGSGQDEYGEGMGDVMGLLITDSPYAAMGFYGDCATPLRNADNDMQYPCSGEIHYCGQLLSGCVWSTRNALAADYPFTYRDILSPIAIDAMMLHAGQSNIAPDITIDYLTLDDDDGNIDNGTPHHNEICAGFSAHNMDCPPLNLLAFSYPNGQPAYVSPSGGTTMRVVVTGVAATPQQNTGVLHYNAGSGWLASNMTQISPNVYDAVFPAYPCETTINYYVSARTTTNTTVNDPQDAPASYYSTVSAADLVYLFSDDFSTNQGWSGLGGSGEWTIGPAVGGTGNQEIFNHGGPDPSVDHTPTSDNRVLGVDLTSGTGGDYSPNLGTTYWVTSPVINCSGRTGITLSFWVWLGVEQPAYDHAYFEVYNGTSWITLYSNPATIDDSSWSQWTYDVSAYANNNSNFRMRFGIGTTDGSWQYCGWNIDDIAVTTVQCDTIANGTLAGTVTDSHGTVYPAYVHAVNGGDSFWDTTATNGTYSLSLPPATYNVSFTNIDHRDTTVTGVVITSNNTTTLNMVMQRLLGAMRGTVTRSGGIAVANVRVVAGSSGREDTTGVDGRYMITGLVDGVYNMFFSHPDYRDTTIYNIGVTPGDSTTLNVRLTELPGYIAGTVRDSTGAPLQNIFVRINSGALLGGVNDAVGNDADVPVIAAVDSMYTDVGGHYISRYLTLATYNVRFTHPDYRDTTIHSVVVTANDTTDVSPVLKWRNRAPVITSPASATATEDIFFSYIATASDSDGVTPTISFSNFASWMSVQGDTIHGTPLNGDGDTSFRIIASDGYLADTQLVAVTVIPVNDPPVVTSPAVDTATERVLFTYHATASDPDDTPILSYANYPSWLQAAGATLYGTPQEGDRDTTFWVIASDGELADTLIVQLAVIDINDPPVITSPSAAEAHEDSLFRYIARATDPEGTPLDISFIHYASWMSPLGDTISGTPGPTATDTSFTIIASDGELADTLLVPVTVIGIDHSPQITSPATATATERQLFEYTATATDPDGTDPVIEFFGYADWLSVDGNIISGTPGESMPDTVFTITASDGELADTLIVALTVIDINDPPVITSPSVVSAAEGESFDYLATGTDPEGTELIFSFFNYPSWLTPNPPHISGIPYVGAGDTSFTVIASDGSLADTLGVDISIAGACDYIVGDVNGNDAFNGLDVTYGVAYFKGGPEPPYSCDCPPHGTWFVAGDVNASCDFNGLDITYMVAYFKGGPLPVYCPDCPPAGLIILGHGHNSKPESK